MSGQVDIAFNKYVAVIGKPPINATHLVKFAKKNEIEGVRYTHAKLYLQNLNPDVTNSASITVDKYPFCRSASSSNLPYRRSLQVRKGISDSRSSASSMSSGANINNVRSKKTRKRRRTRASYHESDSEDENEKKTENVFIPFQRNIKKNVIESEGGSSSFNSIVDENENKAENVFLPFQRNIKKNVIESEGGSSSFNSVADENGAQGLPKAIDIEYSGSERQSMMVNGLNIEQVQQRMHSLHSNLSDLQIECKTVCNSIRDEFSYLHDLLFAKEKAMCSSVESFANDIKHKINEDLHNFENDEMCDFEENFGENRFQGLNVNIVHVERSNFEGLVNVAFVEPNELVIMG